LFTKRYLEIVEREKEAAAAGKANNSPVSADFDEKSRTAATQIAVGLAQIQGSGNNDQSRISFQEKNNEYIIKLAKN